jgi:hypothetical protein
MILARVCKAAGRESAIVIRPSRALSQPNNSELRILGRFAESKFSHPPVRKRYPPERNAALFPAQNWLPVIRKSRSPRQTEG